MKGLEMVIFIVVFMFFWTFLALLLRRFVYKDKVTDKLKYFSRTGDQEIKGETGKGRSERSKKSFTLKTMAGFIPKTPFTAKKMSKLQMELDKADMSVTAEELTLMKIILSVGLPPLGYLLSKDIFITMLVLAAIWIVPRFIIKNKQKKRIQQFNDQLNEALMIIINSLRAGSSFLQFVNSVADETKDPISKEFKTMFKEMSLGIPDDVAFRNIMERVPSPDLTLVITAILIQKDIGGNLSKILENISDTIRERQKIKMEMKTLTAQGRMSGMILTVFPIFLGLVFYIFSKEQIMLLFKTSLGLIMVSVAAVMQFVGYLVINKIVKIEL